MTAVKELSRLAEVELRKIWPDEAQNFTPWLAEEENLTLLSETLGLELELEAQEINVGDFQADILCRNSEDDSRVLIENQLERTDHDHLGKTLTYSAGLDANTVIWIAREFREEHRAALDRLNEMTAEQFRFFGIEIKVWEIGNSVCAPKFEIVSKPNNWSRTINRGTQRALDENVSELRQLQERFWTEFGKYLTNISSPIAPPTPRPAARSIFRIGRADFGVYTTLVRGDRQIRIQLTIRGNNAKIHFYLLKEKREEIEREFGMHLEWSERPDLEESHVYLVKDDIDLNDETDWPNQQKWLAAKIEKFNEVFRPRVKALNAADWAPPEDEDDQ